MPVEDVNYGPGEEPGCKCTKANIPTYLLIWGTLCAAAIILISVLSLMQFDGLSKFILDIYLIVLALLTWTAELRMFKSFRSMIYTWMKFVYFLTSYTGRGLFYIFVGSILFDTPPLNIIVASATVGLGFFTIFGNIAFELPIYKDWQVVKEEAKAKASATKASLDAKINTPSNRPTPKADEGTYQPPGHSI
jgi:hypothetical protein